MQEEQEKELEGVYDQRDAAAVAGQLMNFEAFGESFYGHTSLICLICIILL